MAFSCCYGNTPSSRLLLCRNGYLCILILSKHCRGSRLTFQLASPVASDRFDRLAKTNFSQARRRHYFVTVKWTKILSDMWAQLLLFSSCQAVMFRRNNTINRNAHECFHIRETRSVDQKSHMILWRHELPLLQQAVWTGIERQISMISRKLGKSSLTWKVFTPLILAEPQSKLRK